MKKIILMGFLTIIGLTYSVSSSAFKLLGVEVKYVKGTREWNATKTEAICVGKGMCEITVKGNIGMAYQSGGDGIGTLGFTDGGQFGMTFPKEMLADPYWKETFANGYIYIGKDIELGSDIQSKLKNCPRYIKAGNYKYQIQDGLVLVLF